MQCLDTIKKDQFSLSEIYEFETKLKQKYPDNRFIKEKIRQQLQILRDQNLIEFLGAGVYRKIQRLV